MEYYFFGSEDSKDIDVLVKHPRALGIENDKTLIKELKDCHNEIAQWNINIIGIEDGVVTKSIPSKGNPDSVNNSLYETYALHQQMYMPLPIIHKVERNIPLAIEKCLTAIFTFYKRTDREDIYNSIPRAVKNGTESWDVRKEYLLNVDFSQTPYLNNERNVDSYKSIAFRIGQMISLFDGVEIYTKLSLKKHHPTLMDFIDREVKPNYILLNTKKDELALKIDYFIKSRSV